MYEKSMQLVKELNEKLLNNDFFEAFDKLARYDGKDISHHDKYCIKNLGVISERRFTDEEELKNKEMFKKLSIYLGTDLNDDDEEYEMIDVKCIELKNTARCAPFNAIVIGVPIDKINDKNNNWWEDTLIDRRKFKADIIIDEKSYSFIFSDVIRFCLDCPEYIDRLGIYSYLVSCMEAFEDIDETENG